MFGFSTVKLIGFALAAAAILTFVITAFHWKSVMTERGEKLAVICQTTRTSSGQPKLKCSEVPQQIQFMGEAIGTLTTAIHKQNDAVTAMGARTAQLQSESAKASQKAHERAQGAQATSTRLEASSRSGERQARPCDLSKELKGSWK